MKKVVLFKSATEEYEKALREREYEPVFVEPLQFAFLNEAALRERLLRPEYAALVLSSARAADALARCWDPARFVLWAARRAYALGAAGAQRVAARLGLDARGAAADNAEQLARFIIEENPEGSRFLFPCGNLSLETLPTMLEAAGMIVDSLVVYETQENENLRSRLIDLSLEKPCGLVFFSPSGCEYIHRQLQTFNNALFELPHFAIGNTTAHKIQTLGVEVAGVAERPRPDSVAESIRTFFDHKPNDQT